MPEENAFIYGQKLAKSQSQLLLYRMCEVNACIYVQKLAISLSQRSLKGTHEVNAHIYFWQIFTYPIDNELNACSKCMNVWPNVGDVTWLDGMHEAEALIYDGTLATMHEVNICVYSKKLAISHNQSSSSGTQHCSNILTYCMQPQDTVCFWLCHRGRHYIITAEYIIHYSHQQHENQTKQNLNTYSTHVK